MPAARESKLGVIAKRPIANVAWKSGNQPPKDQYHVEYWNRLQKLDYPFLKDVAAVETALRFTLSVPGVHTAIVGTTKIERYRQNMTTVAAGMLPAAQFEAIRERWATIAQDEWIGQT